MPTGAQILAASALLALGNALPSNLERRGAFTVQQVANKNFTSVPPIFHVARAHAKYNPNGIPPHIHAAAVAAASTGTVSATPGDQYDSEYISPVSINGKTFQLDFDTGSSDLWVLGSTVSGSAGHTTYSTSGQTRTGQTWSITYGDGSSASGNVYSNTVNIGGTQVTGQAVEVATRASSAFTGGPNDGLLGLAFDSINTCSPNRCSTFMTNAVNQGLQQNLFGVTLKYHSAGSYDFGSINTNRYSGSLTYANVDNSQGFWSFTPSSFSVGGGATKTGSLKGIADTGTTLVYAADAVVSAYYAQVSGAQNSGTYGGYVFPCSATLPSFSLIINGYKATVPGQYINYAPVTDGSSTCFGGIQSDDGIGFAIYGDVFLKSQYVVFDRSTPKLGFAPQR